MNRIYLMILFLAVSLDMFPKWNPNAGYIAPYTENSIISTSSGSNKEFVTDGNLETYWESGSQLPISYISNVDLNIFLNRDRYIIQSDNNFLGNAFDGLDASKVVLNKGKLKLSFLKPERVKFFSIKLNSTDSVRIIITLDEGTISEYYSPAENYIIKQIYIPDSMTVNSLELESSTQFDIFEIAGFAGIPSEYLMFDLKNNVEIGWVGSKNYNGDGVRSIVVYASADKSNWKKVCKLDPNATTFVIHTIEPQITARYVKVVFNLDDANYRKAILQEFELYNKYGPFGAPPDPVRSIRTFGESFGINAIWGWGYGIPSTELDNSKGAFLFNRISRLVRNYHSLDWDIKYPGQDPQYDKMKQGEGTPAISWVNWYTEYKNWKDAGFNIDVCLMFNNKYFPDKLWKNTITESRDYGRFFSEFFANKYDLVSLVEIGNEPWEYRKDIYKDILKGMSAGIKNRNENLRVLACAVQAYDKKNSNGNYINQYLSAGNTSNINGLNTHIYSYINTNDNYQIAINPEDRRSEVWSVNNLFKYSEFNLNSLPVYVTEFGYDSEGGGDDCVHSVCISEELQAIYGIRMSLILYRLGVNEFYWYYYANVDGDSFLHNRSGLLSSYSKGMQIKKSFIAFETLQKHIGDMVFTGILSETNDLYVYSFEDKTNNTKALVAWIPTSGNHLKSEWVDIVHEYRASTTIPVIETEKYKVTGFVNTVDGTRVNLCGIPVIIYIQ